MDIGCGHRYLEELNNLSPIEERLIALQSAFGYITKFTVDNKTRSGVSYRKHVKGHIVVFPNKVEDLVATVLPHPLLQTIENIHVSWSGASKPSPADVGHLLQLRKSHVRVALSWLQRNNPLYGHITIDDDEMDGWHYAEDSSVPSMIMERMQREEPSAVEKTQTDHIVPDTDRGLEENGFTSIEELIASVPVLDFGDNFSLINGNAYNKGVYASTLRYRNSTGLFYWIGCMQGTGKTYVYTSPKIEGPLKQTSVISDYCYYDCGLLIGDDDQMYVAYGKWLADGANAVIWVAQLTKDGLQNAMVQQIFHSNSSIGYVEGARFYKRNGKYYIMLTNPGIGEGELILKSSGGSMGPYDSWHQILKNNGNPVSGASHPYQGALIDTPKGDWYYIAFVNRFPGGRDPVLAPVTWDSQGWPNVQFTAGGWGSSYAYPLPKHPVKTVTGTETFNSTTLGPQFEWNHNPDNTKWSTGKGLTLQTATKTDDFFVARNTLSHRALGPKSVVEIELDVSGMVDGDKAGLAIFRYDAAWIGVSMTGSTKSVQMIDGVLMSSSGSWKTTNNGSVIASKKLSGNSVWLRCSTDISGSPGYTTFQYSTDGSNYTSLGQQHTMADGAVFFVGDRWGIFNFATKNLGGKVIVNTFRISQ